ncbi:MAG: hypothetical protein HN531_00160, partial [Opitutae bacterium]|nr:hypothetical protein [Opitutae bacterium]
MIGEHNGDLNSSLFSVVGGGTPIPLINNTSNLQITIPSNYSGDLVYFSTANTSVHYHLKIVDPPGGGYQSSSGTYQPVYDLNSSHISSLAVQVTNSLPGKYAFFNHNNNDGSSEIRFNYMHVSNNQWQDASFGYYVAKPSQFPTIPHIYDYLHSINLSPVNGYKPAGVVYQSSGGGNQSGGGGNNTPQYETQSTLMVDQSTSNTGIPYPGNGATWYQSFTAVNPSKLQKFAFVTNGAFTASATVKIREGEGVTGNVLHTGTWTGIGSNTNTYNEYVIDNDVVLTQGQKYTIQLENQTAGGFLGSNSNQYAGGKFHHSGYGGEYGDLKMKIWVLLQTQPAGGTIAITAPGNGSNADPDTDLTVTVQYASGAGGSQTPTWAYRIDSGFPGYGSPHGGTQITGVTTANDFLSGQSNGMRQVNVALLDQAGNLHNPPIVQTLSVNYQSGGGGNQSGGGGYQSSGGGTIVITAPGNGSNADPDTDLTVTVQYASGGGGSQTPTWAYRIDSGFPGYGSPHGGTQVTGVTSANDFLNGQPNGMRQVHVALLDQNGNLHNSPITASVQVNYQSAGGGNQSGGGGYQTPGNGYQTPGNGYQSPGDGYQSPGNGYQTPGNGYQTPGNGYQSPGNGYQTPGNGYQSPGNGY